MITRPLELASRLRPAPQVLDWLFFVNAGLLVLFFSLFGSRFVLAPGLEVNLPRMQGAGAAQATHYITVTRSGRIFTIEGSVTLGELKNWLADEGKKWRTEPARKNYRPSLLVTADAEVTVDKLAEITTAADTAGFSVRFALGGPAGGMIR